MATFDTSNLAELIVTLEELAILPEDLLEEMLEAQAKIIIPAQKAAAPKDTGTLAASIKASGMKKGKDGQRYMVIKPEGKHSTGKGEKSTASNAQIGYIHEFGAPGRNIPARQWMSAANESVATTATDAAEQVYTEWLNEKGLL